jgi:hypothetical protein
MFIEHQTPCLVQSQPFLVLQGAHCGELAEVVVKGRSAHLHSGRKFIDAKRRGVIQLQPIDGFGDPITLAIDRSYLSKRACSAMQSSRAVKSATPAARRSN